MDFSIKVLAQDRETCECKIPLSVLLAHHISDFVTRFLFRHLVAEEVDDVMRALLILIMLPVGYQHSKRRLTLSRR